MSRISQILICAGKITTGVLTAAFLSGCAGYDLEIDAPILNQVGLTTAKQKMPEIKERAPLVVPPTAQLPVPGSGAAPPADLNWPDDPDVRAEQLAKLKAKQQEELDKKKGPWHKALNNMLGSGDEEEADGNPLPPGSEQAEGSVPASGSGSDTGIDMDQRVQDAMN